MFPFKMVFTSLSEVVSTPRIKRYEEEVTEEAKAAEDQKTFCIGAAPQNVCLAATAKASVIQVTQESSEGCTQAPRRRRFVFG